MKNTVSVPVWPPNESVSWTVRLCCLSGNRSIDSVSVVAEDVDCVAIVVPLRINSAVTVSPTAKSGSDTSTESVWFSDLTVPVGLRFVAFGGSTVDVCSVTEC